MWQIVLFFIALNGEPHKHPYFLAGGIQEAQYATYDQCVSAMAAQSADLNRSYEVARTKNDMVGTSLVFGCIKTVYPDISHNQMPE